jgi:ribosomal protein L31
LVQIRTLVANRSRSSDEARGSRQTRGRHSLRRSIKASSPLSWLDIGSSIVLLGNTFYLLSTPIHPVSNQTLLLLDSSVTEEVQLSSCSSQWSLVLSIDIQYDCNSSYTNTRAKAIAISTVNT